MNYKNLETEVLDLYETIKFDIKARLGEFRSNYKKMNNREVFSELAFCIFTPQSKARSCAKAVEELIEKDLLFKADPVEISECINTVRFRNNKSRYLVNARELFTQDNEIYIRDFLEKYKEKDIYKLREWLVDNIKGIGYKEASHFLRNIGKGKSLAILDRHILKNILSLNIIKEIPKTITKKKYYEIEEKMQKYTSKIGIDMDEFDLLLWFKEAGEIFK